MNPGVLDTEADVIVSAAAAPLTVPVKRDAVVWVQIGGCGDPPAEGCVAVPPNASYTTTVASDIDKPIVAEQFAFYGKGAVGEGVATLMGTPRPQRGAVFALGGVAPSRSGVLAIANPGAVAVTASVLLERAGAEEQPATMHDFQIAPGQQATYDIGQLLGATDGALVVARLRTGRGEPHAVFEGRHHPLRSDPGHAMTARLVLAIVLVVAAAIVAWVLDRRRKPAPPAQSRATVPKQLDRHDFPRPDAPWLVVLWSSRTCESCQGLFEKLTPLASDDVAVVEVEYQAATRTAQALRDRRRADHRDRGPRRRDPQRRSPVRSAQPTSGPRSPNCAANRGLRVRPRSPRSRTPRCRRRG